MSDTIRADAQNERVRLICETPEGKTEILMHVERARTVAVHLLDLCEGIEGKRPIRGFISVVDNLPPLEWGRQVEALQKGGTK